MPLPKAELTRLRALRDKKTREETGLYVIEGPKVVAELLTAGHRFSEIYATGAWRAPVEGVAVTCIDPADMARISHFPTPSPVFAVGRIGRPDLAPAELERGLTLALDGVQDPGNVGTLLRIADWFGFDRVLLSRDSADLFSQKVINASMGSFARLRVIRTHLANAFDVAAPVIGCDLAGESVYQLEPISDAVVVVGSEGRGLSPAVFNRVTRRLTIPRIGRAESLNAAVAAGIVCAQLRRPRGRAERP